jgi:potassium efflux system protein
MLSTRFKRASATLLPLLCLLITFWTPSTLAQDLPQRATVQRALDALGKSDTPTASLLLRLLLLIFVIYV